MDAAKLKEAIALWEPDIHATGYTGLGVLVEAAKKHLATLPQAKEVVVWHVEYVVKPNIPAINVFLSHEDAERFAAAFKNPTEQCVRVTGTHKHLVPA